MPELRGHVDPLGRPIVSVVSASSGDPFLAMVDTGFNGWLMVSSVDAPSIGVRIARDLRSVQMGDGRAVSVRSGRVVLDWLGSRIEVEVFISDEPSRGGEGRPIALVGAELLVPHLLLVDYRAKTVEIETQGD